MKDEAGLRLMVKEERDRGMPPCFYAFVLETVSTGGVPLPLRSLGPASPWCRDAD